MGPSDDLARVRLLRAKSKKVPHQMPWLKGPAPLSQNGFPRGALGWTP